MKIKNIGNKIIGIGNVTIIPDAIETIADSYITHPVIKLLVSSKKIKILDDEAEKEGVKTSSPYAGMKKPELVALATEKGIEISSKDTAKTLVEKLTKHSELDNENSDNENGDSE